jgi:uncharacterized membrane protein
MTASPVSTFEGDFRSLSDRLSLRRVDAVDMLRGLVMVLMMLDHTRDFTHAAGFQHDPSNLEFTTVPIFFTRWITHLCAPTFVFLAGTGAYLQQLRGKSRSELSKFLVTRGLWLIVLEFTIIHLGIGFGWEPTTFIGMAQVIWVIGVSMVVLAALIWLPLWVVAAFGFVMIVGHNALDGFRATPWGGPGSPAPSVGAWIWTVLHQPGMLPLASDGTPMVFNLYPLIPWVGVMAVGYAFGALYRLPAEERSKRMAWIGGTLVGAFLLLRLWNVYGDPSPWAPQKSAVLTVLSFLKVEKYPPSLLFLCIMLGLSLLLLSFFERRLLRSEATALERMLIMFGRVPLFFYLLQWPITHGIGLIALMVTGQDYTRLLHHPILAPPTPAGTGFSLFAVYVFWFLGIALAYFPCRWFAQVKARRRDWWLSYL